MKHILTLIVIIIVLGGVYYFIARNEGDEVSDTDDQAVMVDGDTLPVTVYPISHATMVLDWNGYTLYTDPVGGADAFAGRATPDLILLTDIHGDHLDEETLGAVVLQETTIVAPQAVVDELSEPFASRITVLLNDETIEVDGLRITAIPMYNVPESDDVRHTKGRGNGYVVERDGYRVYIAGDTGDTPEMRALTDIDLAFVPMNLPYTMSVEAAADAVLDFAPSVVYPYHYRGQDGLSDISRFYELVTEGNPAITVRLADWYSE